MQAVANAVVPPGTALGTAAAPRSLRPSTCKLSWLPLSTPASSWAPQWRPAPPRQFRAGCRGGCCRSPKGPGPDSRVRLLPAEDVPAAVVFRVRPRIHLGAAAAPRPPPAKCARCQFWINAHSCANRVSRHPRLREVVAGGRGVSTATATPRRASLPVTGRATGLRPYKQAAGDPYVGVGAAVVGVGGERGVRREGWGAEWRAGHVAGTAG